MTLKYGHNNIPMTEEEFWKHDIVDGLRWDDLRDSKDLDRLLMECYLSTEMFCKVFMPRVFNKPFLHIHHEIFEVIDAKDTDGTPKYKQIVVKAPRGIGKTSLLGKGLAAKEVLYADTPFLCYIGKSADHAIMQTENLKMELRSNILIRKIFGDIAFRDEENDISDLMRFSSKFWVTDKNVLVMPRGSGQQVRGLLYGSSRPNRFRIDDFEDKKEIENETIRAADYEWYQSDLLEAKPQYDPDYQFIHIDTLKHEDALLAKLMSDPDWTALSFSICDENYKSLVPEFVSDEELAREVESARKRGTLDVFYREKMGLPIATETAAFRKEYFKYYEEGNEEFQKSLARHDIKNVVIVDPAKTPNLNSADSAIVGWGVDNIKDCWYFRDCVSGKFDPEGLYDAAIDMAISLKAPYIAVEETGLNEFIKQPFTQAIKSRGVSIELVWLKARRGQGEFSGVQGGKKARIASLVAPFRQGKIFLNQTVCGPLEGQLLSFPRSKKWDVMDAAAYIVEIIEQYLLYYMGEYLDSEDGIEEEFKELEGLVDDELEDDWRLMDYDPAGSMSIGDDNIDITTKRRSERYK